MTCDEREGRRKMAGLLPSVGSGFDLVFARDGHSLPDGHSIIIA